MKHKITKTLLILFAAFCFTFLPVTPTFAEQCSSKVCSGSYPDSVKAACGCGNSSSKELPDVAINIINIIIGISGIVAVVFIVIGGINYMTSTGDAGKVKKAKDTILYAVIGLVICALSFAIVNWAISTINKNPGSNSDNNNPSTSEDSKNKTDSKTDINKSDTKENNTTKK